jgi:hypothetical protein
MAVFLSFSATSFAGSSISTLEIFTFTWEASEANVNTRESVLKTELTFPAETEVVMSAENATRFVMAEVVKILAMGKVNFPVGGVGTASTKNVLGDHAFAETDADFAAVIGLNEEQAKRETVSTRNLSILDWAAIMLIEAESGLVDYIVPIETDIQVMGIALRHALRLRCLHSQSGCW